tara:strand:- start:6780 stop:6968 length:189 start_codon:yes stop_codon:yes gene_type:complete
MLPLFKILTPKVLKAIMSYVFEKNELDEQMGSVRARLDKLESIKCKCCKNKINRMKNYEGTD